jgi:hypothetical protein
MKFVKIVTFLTLLIILISCGGNDKTSAPNDTPKKTEAVKSALIANDGSVSVKMNFQGGEKYELIVSTDEKLSQEMQGEKQSVSQLNTITYDLDLAMKANDLFSADIKFKRIQKSVDAGAQGKQSFDSQQKGDTKEMPPNVKILLDIIGKNYILIFNPLGRVKETLGADKMLQQIMAGVKENDEVKKMISEALKLEFGPDKLADFFEKLTNYTDSVPRKIGEKWTKVYSIESGINLAVATTYEIAEIKDGQIKINLKSQLNDKNKNRSKTIGEVVLKASISGEQGGFILLDGTTGFINKSEVTQKIYVNETRSKKDDPSQSLTMKTTKEAKFTIMTAKRK